MKPALVDLFPSFKVSPRDASRELKRQPAPAFCPRPREAQPPAKFDRAAYLTECEKRWYGPALRDARANWSDFQELKPTLTEALRKYRHDPCLEDLSGKLHNPDGTLGSFLWRLQESLEPNRSCLLPLLDFEEHYQRVFLRRGLIIYCTMLLREMEATSDA